MRQNRPRPSPGGPAPGAWGPQPLPAGAWRSVTRAVVETQRSQWEQGLTSPGTSPALSAQVRLMQVKVKALGMGLGGGALPPAQLGCRDQLCPELGPAPEDGIFVC